MACPSFLLPVHNTGANGNGIDVTLLGLKYGWNCTLFFHKTKRELCPVDTTPDYKVNTMVFDELGS